MSKRNTEALLRSLPKMRKQEALFRRKGKN